MGSDHLNGQRWIGSVGKGKGSHLYKEPVPYSLGRREIYSKGLMLTPDEVMRANKVKNILWWKVELFKKEKSTPRKRSLSELKPTEGKVKSEKVG